MMITVYKNNDDENREAFDFNCFGFTIVLVGYSIQVKPKRKRIWVTKAFWDTYRERDSSIKESPTIPEDIKQRAINHISGLVKVMTWREWKK